MLCGARRTLTLRYPQQADAAVNAALADLRRSAEPARPSNRALKRARAQAAKVASAQDGAGGAGELSAVDEVEDPARLRAQRVLDALQGALAGSASAPVAGAGSTLMLAVDAPAAEVRALVGTLAEQHTCGEQPAQDVASCSVSAGTLADRCKAQSYMSPG